MANQSETSAAGCTSARNVWRDTRRFEERCSRLAGKADIIPLQDESCDEPIIVCLRKEAVERADAVIHREVSALQPKDQAIANGILKLVSRGELDRAPDREALARRFRTTPGGLRQAIHRINSGCYLRVREELGDEVFRLFRPPDLNSTDVLLALADEAECDGVAHAAIVIKLVEDHLGRIFSDQRELTESPDPQSLDDFFGNQQDLRVFHAVRVHEAATNPAVAGYADIMRAFLQLHLRAGLHARLMAGELVGQPVDNGSSADAIFKKGLAGLAGQNDGGRALPRFVQSFLECRWARPVGPGAREEGCWGDSSPPSSGRSCGGRGRECCVAKNRGVRQTPWRSNDPTRDVRSLA